ncbi:MAG: alpha/beta hydrolase [Scytonematopsis contorta HA4267-MV1]|nr:alpha/beta hydrolase [Scytonematopsis contorta HA4267-MV1]
MVALIRIIKANTGIKKWENAIRSIKCPVLIVHGSLDTYIPFANGKKLFNAAPSPKEFYEIPQASHETMLRKGGDELRRKIIGFVLNRN